MPQHTLIFVIFAAAAVALFWATPRRFRPTALLVESVAFLVWLDFIALAFLALAGAAVYLTSRRAAPTTRSGIGSPDWVLVALVVVFLLARAGQRADRWFGLPALIVPAGFGFSMLRLLHYRIERRRDAIAAHGFATFMRYLLFFPTIAVGPIHRIDDFLRSEARHRWDSDRAGRGLRRVLFGYVKVVVLANWLVWDRDLFVSLPLASPVAEWLFESLQYGFYLYFAFAGYSDIAIGLALLLGYEVGENFRFPFLQPNLGAFWRSWHISLSDWCRRYVFLPVLARWRRVVPALFTAMIVLGLWHELSPRFLAWGAWHAAGLSAWRASQRWLFPRLPRARSTPARAAVYLVSTAATLSFVVLGFTLIKEPSLGALWDQLHDLFAGHSP